MGGEAGEAKSVKRQCFLGGGANSRFLLGCSTVVGGHVVFSEGVICRRSFAGIFISNL